MVNTCREICIRSNVLLFGLFTDVESTIPTISLIRAISVILHKQITNNSAVCHLSKFLRSFVAKKISRNRWKKLIYEGGGVPYDDRRGDMTHKNRQPEYEYISFDEENFFKEN